MDSGRDIGAVVVGVRPGGAADGVAALGDELVAFNGYEVTSASYKQILSSLTKHAEGGTAKALTITCANIPHPISSFSRSPFVHMAAPLLLLSLSG